MGRFRLDPPPALGDDVSDRAVRAGVTLHHRTDEAFHRHPWFTGRVRSLRDDLEADGLPRGAARAIAHVGPELLLDGLLLADSRAAGSVGAALGALAEHHDRLGSWASPPDAWAAHLRRLAGHGLPSDYADPEAVAHRLLRILGRRHRLGFAPHQVSVVSRHLADRQPSIDATGWAFLDEVVDAVEELVGQPPTADF